MIPFDSVRLLHLEITSRCNASCPACARNVNGFGLAPGLIEADLPVDRLREILDLLSNVEVVHFCGDKGDCMAAKNFDEHLDEVLSRNVRWIKFHTNGSLKTTDWWTRLGEKLRDVYHEVLFGLDGLEDTHAIYRQNTSFNKVIDNAVAFMAGGGKAAWQFLPFAHNEHQIPKAYKLSKSLGFYRFELIHSPRILQDFRHHITNQKLDIRPWSRATPIYLEDNDHIRLEDCMHKNFPSVYLGHEGTLSHCCYHSGIPIEQLDIDGDFERGSWNAQCLKCCGSKR